MTKIQQDFKMFVGKYKEVPCHLTAGYWIFRTFKREQQENKDVLFDRATTRIW